MARSYAQLHTSIWQDRDFCSLPGFAQRVYLLLISQPTVSYAGVLAYTERRFAAMSGDATNGEIADAMCVLEDAGYVVTDDDTEEVWVRSWSRYNGVLDHPNLRKAMVAAYNDVLSPGITAAIFAEYGSDEKLLLTTPAEPEANPSRRQREPDGSPSVQVTSREDLDLDLHVHKQGERHPTEPVAADLISTKDEARRSEVDGIVTVLAAQHGAAKVEAAIVELLAKPGRYAFASDVRKALEVVLGSPPLDAKPHVLDEAQIAQRQMAERDQAEWKAKLDAAPPPSETGRSLAAEARAAVHRRTA